ncbi:carboxyltransferase domain-containing protein [Saccharopolyspora sp. K220]|uniref:5-oxoprolinase subunit B family protein n=1 Tax=Saccharopolyspora soli TaxID=2926618 RepID=UPI001F594CA4|nr:carboxyltransferase domain-containing protein [Saccharopolyspora soli]MCI2422652.1 carboxyltransferase domain-containing protein [Saccharopolyspora soli]
MSRPAALGTFNPPHGPVVTYRPAGDQCVLMEYGSAEPDLALNFFVVRALAGLTADPPPGFIEAAPGFRSILVKFDPTRCSRALLLDHLTVLHERQPDISSLVVPSRLITLPIAFDDSETRRAVELYARTIRPDAPYLTDDRGIGYSNTQYIVAQNRLSGPEELYQRILGTEWWTAFIGFAPGLPFTFSLRDPTGLSVPKYNPTRAWTPEGAVGMGGPCLAVFPVESPGSYQLLGRTLPIFDMLGRNAVFRDSPFLARAGDRLRFVRVEEDELADVRRQVLEDRYRYQIEDAPFVVADYLAGTR